MTEEKWIAAADVGGSHITVGVIDLNNIATANGQTEWVAVDSKGTETAILASWYQAFDRLCQQMDRRPAKIAFAMPGPFDYQHGISLIKGVDKYENLYGVDIRQAFAARFGIAPENVRFRNDAEAFLHGEVIAAGLPANERVLGFTLGTGFGSAFSHNGTTKDLNTGLEPYKKGIVDEYLTTRWFLQAAQHEGLRIDSVAALAQRALDGDERACRIFDEFARNLAEVMSRKVTEWEATTIILGGNIAKAQALFLPALRAAMHVRGLTPNCHLARLGERAAMLGAACLFDKYHITKHLTL